MGRYYHPQVVEGQVARWPPPPGPGSSRRHTRHSILSGTLLSLCLGKSPHNCSGARKAVSKLSSTQALPGAQRAPFKIIFQGGFEAGRWSEKRMLRKTSLTYFNSAFCQADEVAMIRPSGSPSGIGLPKFGFQGDRGITIQRFMFMMGLLCQELS